MKSLGYAALLWCGLAGTALADDFVPGTRTSVVLGGAWTFGGDKLAEYEVEYSDGDSSREKIKAGENLHFFVGAYMENRESEARAYGAQLTLGWFFDSISGKNGEVTLDRFPIEVIPYVKLNKFRLGMGLTYHTNITLEDNAVLNDSVDFDNAAGLVVIAEYMVAQQVGIGLRYVNIDYDLDVPGVSRSFDASHVGLGATVLF